MTEKMTSKERVLTALAHKETDRVPISRGFGPQPPLSRALAKYLNLEDKVDGGMSWCDSLADLAWVKADWKGPKERGSFLDADAARKVDFFGIVRQQKSYGKGENQGFYDEYTDYPLAKCETLEELEQYWWPSADWYDFSRMKEHIARVNAGGEKAILLTPVATVYEHAWQMTGMQKMFVDLLENPEFASEVMRRVADFYIAYFRRALEAADGQVDLVFCGDDLGTQISLQMSLEVYREVIKPHHKRLFDVIHEYGARVLYHCDGAIMPVIPELMDAGVDVLEALQFDARGMDPQVMKDNWGDRLCFHGGVSVQSTLPFKTVRDVEQEVRERIDVLGKDGGYIIAPSHAMQAGTPPENVIAFFETAGNYRRK
ncbi:uroporphyrinogen decarboxylase family protein [Ruminococcus gauvreauii]|uniref:Uroporphyrinogen decarboxylase family protein n=1 Tax=Ruminococcus gauvreauii TaxID=438033 RepID=A0ABY5VDN0_9FIRM|nr:uroporphyrinogen decarboxylase family protein [Ruminococcus gauvreauii]UWP58303.1 uroporphyrinogen decarboxylase family protein [Ruminococcus gauvreauii]